MDSRFFGPIFEPWAILEPKWLPSLPREPPGLPQTEFVVDFGSFGTHFFSNFGITKSEKSNAKLLVFETIVCSVSGQTGLKNQNAQLQGSRRKGTVAGSARNALR